MKPAAILKQRVRQHIQARTDKVLRELGDPEPPLRLEDVRELLRLDCGCNTITTTLWRMIEYAGEEQPIIGAVGLHPGAQDEGPCFRHLIPSVAFDQKFEVPDPNELISSIRNYCRLSGRGHLGHGEIVMQDRSTRRHVFDFETFYNG